MFDMSIHESSNKVKKLSDVMDSLAHGKEDKNESGHTATKKQSTHSAQAEVFQYKRDKGDDNSYIFSNLTEDVGNDNISDDDTAFLQEYLGQFRPIAERVKSKLLADKQNHNNRARPDKGNDNIESSAMAIGNDNISKVAIEHSTNNITLIRSRAFDDLRIRMNPEPKTFASHQEIYDYLVKQDLRKFLGVGAGRFECVFPHDGNRMATIYVNHETGVNQYRCDNRNCLMHGKSITDLTMKLTGLERTQATIALTKVYGIRYQLSKSQADMMDYLNNNIQFLIHVDSLAAYPNLYRIMGKYTQQLIYLHKMTQDNLLNEVYWRNGSFYGFTSMRYLAKELNYNGPDYINKIFNLFAVLGLVYKYNNHEIPNELFRLSQGYNATKKRKQSFITTYYYIPAYDKELLASADNLAGYLLENGFTMKGFGRAMFLRWFPQGEVDRFFPQHQTRELSAQVSDTQTQLMDLAAQEIAIKGYIREKDVLKEFKRQYGGKSQFVQLQLKSIIPVLLTEYGLEKIKVNRKFKESHGITDKGFFNVYVWNGEYNF